MVVLGLTLIIGVFFLSCSKKTEDQTVARQTENTFRVAKSEIIASVEEEGEIAPMKSVEVKPSISGRVSKVFVNEGDNVVEGQIVAEIVADRDQTRSINNIVTSYKEAEINFENAERDYEEVKELFKKNFVSNNEMINAENRLRIASLRYESAREEYQLALREIDINVEDPDKTSAIRAPLSGIVLRRFVEVGELVSGETTMRSGTVLFTIADSKDFVVKVDINEFDVERIQHGQKVEIRRGRDRSDLYIGRVFKISPLAEVSDGVKVYPVEIELTEGTGSLRFGMSSTVKIITAQKEDTLVIPVSALFINDRRQEYVMVRVEDGSFQERFVKRGINTAFQVEITEGLEEGEVVMNQGSMRGMAGGARTSGGMTMPFGGIGGRR